MRYNYKQLADLALAGSPDKNKDNSLRIKIELPKI
jgi:hypothetical protein